ncbi:CPBP family intramembrane glutamic endopeptidase [Natronomonas sp.]|uniref:CPBP family intramembrane glutamic endopeptidase n=1 Tax=Natronomonas sp. TaxID=2184060 RepID=UPI002FC3DC2F
MSDTRIPFVDEHPVAAFFVGAYLYTWVISAPTVFMDPSWTAAILMYVGSFGAPVSAAAVTWLRGDDVRAWARQITRWRVDWYWWVAAFGLPLAIVGVVTAILLGVGGPVDIDQFGASPVLVLVIFVFGMTVSGGLNEEPGWRGFAQPRLNDRYSALTGSLIIGVVWAGWHLPYFFIPVAPHSGFTVVNQVGWFFGILLLSVILAWGYNGTGSVLIVMVLHAMANTADVLLPLAPDLILVDGIIDETAVGTVVLVQIGVQLLVVVAIVAYYGREKLARGEIPGAADAGGRDNPTE